ncbi:MAG: 3D domain-containing protein [Candidatus Margulisbacteria bacterium]|jgi:3D (Asp-Asp-Asp) domain-containing protein|nr:3D domain-containing protein [Candidatus Margulisiibacteriota bacterium]
MRKRERARPAYIPIIATILLSLSLIPIGYLVMPKSLPHGYRVVSRGTILASAYNSLPGQTDDSPWITASGTRCREGVIASNHFPIGTKLYIEGYRGRVFVVEDRMNARYKKKIDIWFREYNDARRFGVRKVKYYVVKSA